MRTRATSSESLAAAVLAHLRACQLAYGTAVWKPKHHMATHLPRQLQCHGTLLSCFVHERRHKLVKRFISDRRTLQSFERGVMEEMTTKHCAELSESWAQSGLVAPTAPRPALRAALLASWPAATSLECSVRVVVAGTAMIVGDVVVCMLDGALLVAELWFNAAVDGVLVSCVSTWEQVTEHGARCRTCRKRDSPRLVAMDALVAPCIYMRGGGDLVTVLLPMASLV
jgi:hypothetical protein